MQIVIDLSIEVKKTGRVYFCTSSTEPSVCYAKKNNLCFWSALIIAPFPSCAYSNLASWRLKIRFYVIKRYFS